MLPTPYARHSRMAKRRAAALGWHDARRALVGGGGGAMAIWMTGERATGGLFGNTAALKHGSSDLALWRRCSIL
jgi:hypothetical protein